MFLIQTLIILGRLWRFDSFFNIFMATSLLFVEEEEEDIREDNIPPGMDFRIEVGGILYDYDAADGGGIGIGVQWQIHAVPREQN